MGTRDHVRGGREVHDPAVPEAFRRRQDCDGEITQHLDTDDIQQAKDVQEPGVRGAETAGSSRAREASMEPQSTEHPTTIGFFRRIKEIGLCNTLLEIEREAIEVALQATEGNKSQAARLLGVKRTKLISRMKTMHGMSLLPPTRKGEPRDRIKEPEIKP
jgi:DNA-binding NtrC family response regulator